MRRIGARLMTTTKRMLLMIFAMTLPGPLPLTRAQSDPQVITAVFLKDTLDSAHNDAETLGRNKVVQG